MLPSVKKYSIFPSVVPADKDIQMTVAPNERAFLLFEDEKYTVTVIPVNADVPSRKSTDHKSVFNVKASGGVIKFNFTFREEQEHTVIISLGEKHVATLAVYSLYDDLYPLIPLRGDLHLHSYRSDGQQDPAALMGHFREQGYDFMTLSDHNRYYPGGEIDEVYKDVKLGITHIQGEELHIPETPIHIVGLGGRASVAEIYVENSEEYQKEMAEYKASVPNHVPTTYADRYAMAKWVCDRVHAFGGIAIFPHPYWIPVDSKAFNVCDGLASLLISDKLFDAYELIGGMEQSYNNRSVALWVDLRAKGINIPVVGSSDVHNVTRSEEFPHKFTVCFAKSNTEDDIMDAVKNGNSLAVEAHGDEYDREYRTYGSLRLVSYARFLFENYFSELQRVCQGEGIAMRNYAMGLTPKETVELQVKQTQDFKDRFFGKCEPTLPSSQIIEFENRWRERHCKGPVTKGSRIDSQEITRQI